MVQKTFLFEILERKHYGRQNTDIWAVEMDQEVKFIRDEGALLTDEYAFAYATNEESSKYSDILRWEGCDEKVETVK